MADFASIDAHGGVLVQVRSTLVDVAFHARLLVHQSLANHTRPDSHAPGGRICPVRIVAVGTLHEALVNTVFDGQRELRADIGVAPVAELVLDLREQELRGLRTMDGMTVVAADVAECVLGSSNIGP